MSVPRAEVHKADTPDGAPDAWYFVIKAVNGEVVATSELYLSEGNAERGARDLRNLIRSKAFRVEHA